MNLRIVQKKANILLQKTLFIQDFFGEGGGTFLLLFLIAIRME